MAAWLTKELYVPLGQGHQWRAPLWAILLAMAVMLFFCRLGMWQVGRAAEKAQMVQRYEARAGLPVQALADAVVAGDVEDRRVVVRGRWDHQKQVFLENQMRGPKAGFHVYAVFLPEGGQTAVLVNRGWVAMSPDVQRLPAVAAPVGNRIEGSLALPSEFYTVGEPDYSRQPLRVPRLDIPRLSAALGIRLQPFVLRMESGAPDGLVREWAPAKRLGMSPDKHHAYAFQWFSLAVAVFVVLLVVNIRKCGDAES